MSDIKCENDPGFGACEEAIRFIKSTPRWQPAIQNGKKVNAYLRQPITFIITTEKGNAGKTSMYNFNNTKRSGLLYVSYLSPVNYLNTTTGSVRVRPAIQGVVLTESYANKVCSNISVQK